jgi:hypothetical protein
MSDDREFLYGSSATYLDLPVSLYLRYESFVLWQYLAYLGSAGEQVLIGQSDHSSRNLLSCFKLDSVSLLLLLTCFVDDIGREPTNNL